MDKRSKTSVKNGKKGGRPKGSKNKPKLLIRPQYYDNFTIKILKSDTTEQINAGKNNWDFAVPVERALIKALPPGTKVYVQTEKRIHASQIEYSYNNNSPANVIRINGRAIKFPWEVLDYMTHFVFSSNELTDYIFTLKIPKDWGLESEC